MESFRSISLEVIKLSVKSGRQWRVVVQLHGNLLECLWSLLDVVSTESSKNNLSLHLSHNIEVLYAFSIVLDIELIQCLSKMFFSNQTSYSETEQ